MKPRNRLLVNWNHVESLLVRSDGCRSLSEK